MGWTHNETRSTQVVENIGEKRELSIEIKRVFIDVYILCLYQNIPLQYR